jgi:lipoprotein signal peptidase
VTGLVVWLRRAETWLIALSLGAIAGGAVGNVVDRLRFGWVEDFIHFHVGGWNWYVFNVADAAIVCGVAALVLDGLRPHRSRSDDETLARPGPAEL